MMLFAGLLILGVAAGWSNAACGNYPDGHTMCLTDVGTAMDVTSSAQTAVVNKHNEYRAEVEQKSANMQKMVWDANLATVAQKWAQQCTSNHDSHDARKEPLLSGISIGQNIAVQSPVESDILKSLNQWYGEKKDFSYGVYTSATIGHYTQMIYDDTARVGCGMANCAGAPNSKWDSVVVCNYALGQSGNVSIAKPYTESTTTTGCSACTDKCDSTGSLCDCGGKVCLNGGTLQLNTCLCQCAVSWVGDTCQTKECPAADGSMCAAYLAQLSPGPTKPCEYDNVRNEHCPKTCCERDLAAQDA